MKQKWTATSLLLIILAALVLRVLWLDRIPNGLYNDEASIGYNAYAIAQSGQDEHGQAYPIYFKAFGDFKNPIFIYLAAVFVKLLGLSEFSLRLTAAFLGVVTVGFTYLLARKLFNPATGLLAAAFLAVSPWHLQFSRIAFEAIALPCLFVIGLYLLLLGLEKSIYLVWGGMVLALAFYCYAPGKLFIPLFLLGFFWIYRSKLWEQKQRLWLALSYALLLLIPLIALTWQGDIQTRFNGISVFSDAALANATYKLSSGSLKMPPFFQNQMGNRSFVTPYLIIRNYLLHFSPNYLFFKGDSNLRHSIGNTGVLHYFEGIFIILGICFTLRRLTSAGKLILWWLLIFPVAASLTCSFTFDVYDLPHAIRSLDGLPVFQIIAAVGLVSTVTAMYSRLKHQPRPYQVAGLLAGVVVTGAILLNVSFYLHRYFISYPQSCFREWNYGMRQVFAATESLSDIGKFYFQGDFDTPYIYALFYTRYDPRTWASQYHLPRYEFSEPPQHFYQRTGLVVSGAPTDAPGKLLRTIYYPDRSIAFQIREIEPDPVYRQIIGLNDLPPGYTGGLTATYYTGANFETPVNTRVDPEIAFSWGDGAPTTGVGADNFSVRWEGYLKITQSSLYTFHTTSDDGVRLWIDGKPVIANWNPHATTEDLATLPLEPGWHPIILEYNDTVGGALIELAWSSPDFGKTLIDAAHFSYYPLTKHN